MDVDVDDAVKSWEALSPVGPCGMLVGCWFGMIGAFGRNALEYLHLHEVRNFRSSRLW